MKGNIQINGVPVTEKVIISYGNSIYTTKVPPSTFHLLQGFYLNKTVVLTLTTLVMLMYINKTKLSETMRNLSNNIFYPCVF